MQIVQNAVVTSSPDEAQRLVSTVLSVGVQPAVQRRLADTLVRLSERALLRGLRFAFDDRPAPAPREESPSAPSG